MLKKWLLSGVILFFCVNLALAHDPLPSWNEGKAKNSILSFVQKVNQKNTPEYIPEAERIVVFDNDGTLWAEQPMYVQLAFAMDRTKELAARHPEWKTTQPFKAVLENDYKALAQMGEKGILTLLMATHAGMTPDEFEQDVKKWLMTAKHPRFNVPYNQMVYQPMIELLGYLRANGFKTFIVSGGGIEFMRAWVEKAYRIPPEQVVGSSIKLKYENINDKPKLIRLPEINFIDDKAGKPVGIQLFIGRQPIAAFGNSDGDLEMLQWTTKDKTKPRLAMIIHHDDGVREWKYDKDSYFGRLDKALIQAPEQGWIVVSMKNDWNKVFSFEKNK